ncbi:ribonuclease H1-like, partial [Penaeus chinensis]|uniref:ribonuclease H1-like n=1 Tax=Penaeus chinensis TaxID=139456 RepID=UPI001FB837B9
MPFYAVARGHSPGVYTSWPDAQAQINGYTAARYKKFDTKDEAEEFVKENALNKPVVDRREKASGDAQVEGKRKRDDDEEEEEGQGEKKLHVDEGEKKTEDGLSLDDEGYLVVYSVGVCEFHGKSGQKSGCGVFFAEDHERNVSVPLKGKASNNAADIQAATHALITAKAAGHDKVAVHTDSQVHDQLHDLVVEELEEEQLEEEGRGAGEEQGRPDGLGQSLGGVDGEMGTCE